jgi:hypothetical protein
MRNVIAEMSPRVKARLAGVFFLLTTVLGVIAQVFVSERLVAGNDAALTASNILNNETLFRLGFAIYMLEMVCQITMTALFYELLKPVNKGLSMLSAWISLTGCVVKIFTRVFYIAPLFLLSGEPYLKVFSAEQTQSLALLSLKINEQGAAIALLLFGFATILKGWLVFKSTFLPRFLGVVSIIAGLGWLCFLYPPLAYKALPVMLLLGLIGTVLHIFWLLVFGVDEARWKEMARAAAESIYR